jgi:FemAB-related protein (PEP-CTERM system-associated)
VIRIRPLSESFRPQWDAFVHGHPDGTFFHKSGWAPVLEQSFGHKARYLYAERDGVLAGVLPMTQVGSWLFGKALISTAFCVYGGPLASGPEIESALRAAAVAEMNKLDAERVEFRFRSPRPTDWQQVSGRYATFRRPIYADPEKNLLSIPRKQRAVVRKTIGGGLTAECDTDVGRLHRVYSESVRNLGSPVFSRRYFRALIEEFGSECEILTVTDRGEPVASVLSFFFREEVLPYYGGGTGAARRSGANDFMYWEVMRRAGLRGYRVFDFGRSKIGTGAYDFKKNWGFAPEPLVYEFRLRAGCTLPDTSPMNPKLQRYINTWKRLPLPVTNFIGPRLIRGLGLGA